ncbi:hypothetical protein GCM10010425_10100 [Streptomyces spororaveus]
MVDGRQHRAREAERDEPYREAWQVPPPAEDERDQRHHGDHEGPVGQGGSTGSRTHIGQVARNVRTVRRKARLRGRDVAFLTAFRGVAVPRFRGSADGAATSRSLGA